MADISVRVTGRVAGCCVWNTNFILLAAARLMVNNGRMRRLTHEEFVKRANKKHNNKFQYLSHYVDSETLITIECPSHGKFEMLPHQHLNSFGCRKCGITVRGKLKRKTQSMFVEEAQKIHNNTYSYEKFVYDGAHIISIITCVLHGDFLMTPHNHIGGKQGCPECGRIARNDKRRKPQAQFIEEASKRHNNKYNYSKVVYVNTHTKIDVVCHIHGTFSIDPGSHLIGNGCFKCGIITSSSKNRKTQEQFIDEALNIHGDKFDYSKVEYVNINTPVIIKCPSHGEFLMTPYSHNFGNGCPNCKHKGEGMLAQFLAEQKIDFQTQVRFPWTGRCRYDFIIEDLKVIVEHDGAQHFRPIEHWGGTDSFLLANMRDKFKIYSAVENGYRVIRIYDVLKTKCDWKTLLLRELQNPTDFCCAFVGPAPDWGVFDGWEKVSELGVDCISDSSEADSDNDSDGDSDDDSDISLN
jgi:very-short-patch-repair endonuclease/predicted RNA-binding Zn-ribbon protein involved in translation (DUF1610 family)